MYQIAQKIRLILLSSTNFNLIIADDGGGIQMRFLPPFFLLNRKLLLIDLKCDTHAKLKNFQKSRKSSRIWRDTFYCRLHISAFSAENLAFTYFCGNILLHFGLGWVKNHKVKKVFLLTSDKSSIKSIRLMQLLFNKFPK